MKLVCTKVYVHVCACVCAGGVLFWWLNFLRTNFGSEIQMKMKHFQTIKQNKEPNSNSQKEIDKKKVAN